MQGLKPVTVASGLDNPWAIAFLPGGRMLVTERPGRMRVISTGGRTRTAAGRGSAGLGQRRRRLAGRRAGPETSPQPHHLLERSASRTRAATARVRRSPADGFADDRVDDVRVIFRQPEKSSRGHPLRLAPRSLHPDGLLFVGLGDRGQPRRRPAARFGTRQDPADAHRRQRAAGQSVRRFARRRAADLDARSPQRARAWRSPQDGTLWATEHGPQGGDELNIIVKGRNYGWPTITYGTEYPTSATIGEGVREGRHGTAGDLVGSDVERAERPGRAHQRTLSGRGAASCSAARCKAGGRCCA